MRNGRDMTTDVNTFGALENAMVASGIAMSAEEYLAAEYRIQQITPLVTQDEFRLAETRAMRRLDNYFRETS